MESAATNRPVARAVPSTAKGRAMRDRLVAAALRCFTEHGYAVTSVADITAAAGAAHGTFYRYFVNVDDVLLAAVTGPLDELFIASRRPPAAQAASPVALVEWHRRFLHAYARHRVVFAVMREAAAVDRGQGFVATWLGLRSRFVDEVERWVRDVEAAHGPDPAGMAPADLAAVLGAMGEQVAHAHLGLAVEPPTDREIDELARALGAVCHRTVVAPRVP